MGSPAQPGPERDNGADEPPARLAPVMVARARQVSKAWGLLLVALSVLTLGLRGYLLERVHDGFLTVWQITWLALPLVAATTIVVYRWRARRPTSFAGFIGIVLGTLAASWLTGISSGERVVELLFHFDASCVLSGSCPTPSGDNPISLIFKVIRSYLEIYGPTGFVSALAVGGFMGYALAVLSGTDRGRSPKATIHSGRTPAPPTDVDGAGGRTGG